MGLTPADDWPAIIVAIEAMMDWRYTGNSFVDSGIGIRGQRYVFVVHFVFVRGAGSVSYQWPAAFGLAASTGLTKFSFLATSGVQQSFSKQTERSYQSAVIAAETGATLPVRASKESYNAGTGATIEVRAISGGVVRCKGNVEFSSFDGPGLGRQVFSIPIDLDIERHTSVAIATLDSRDLGLTANVSPLQVAGGGGADTVRLMMQID